MTVFTVIVPTYNRPEALDRLLASLAAQTLDSDQFEVSVVDDGSHTELGPVIDRYAAHLQIRLIRCANAGPANARNLGAGEAAGEYLAFTDDDCRPAPGWLEALHQALSEAPGALCGGPIANGLPDDPYSEATTMLSGYFHERYSPTSHLGGFYSTNNLTVQREAFLAARGFDGTLRFGEDREFCYRWALRGGPFRYVPGARVYHEHNLDLFSFLRLHYCYGGGTAAFHRCVSQGSQARVTLSRPKWYLDLILTGLRQKKGLAGLRITLLLAATQAAAAAGFFSARLRPSAATASQRVPPGAERRTR